MRFIPDLTPRPLYLHLKQDRSKAILQGHPWVFAHTLKELPPTSPGTRALLKDKDGKIIAKGMYDPKSVLAFRVCAQATENLDDDLIVTRLQSAITLRQRLFPQPSTTNAYRLINGEGDLLPGLVCDIYNDCAVFQLDGAGPAGFWNIEEIAAWLAPKLSLKHLLFKARSNDSADTRNLGGTQFNGVATFRENNLCFEADLLKGQKTGFFLDQRDNRKKIGELSKGQRVLNLFGYTGGFSVYAGAGGAREVTTVDLAKPAILAAQKNWELNDLRTPHEAVATDAFEFLDKSKLDRQQWDIVVVDPPSFASSKETVEKAQLSYIRLLTLATQVTTSGGILAASSCSSHISSEMFYSICEQAISKARGRGTILSISGQPEDHPFPLACEELRYLKFMLIQISK